MGVGGEQPPYSGIKTDWGKSDYFYKHVLASRAKLSPGVHSITRRWLRHLAPGFRHSRQPLPALPCLLRPCSRRS